MGREPDSRRFGLPLSTPAYARRAAFLACVALLVAACDEPAAPPIVVPTSPVYVTTNNTVNVYPAVTAAPATVTLPPVASAAPSEPSPAPLPRARPAQMPPPLRVGVEPTQRTSVGVIECDQYIARIARCTAGMKDKFDPMLDTMWESYKLAARTADGRASIAIGCRGGLEMVQCDASP